MPGMPGTALWSTFSKTYSTGIPFVAQWQWQQWQQWQQCGISTHVLSGEAERRSNAGEWAKFEWREAERR